MLIGPSLAADRAALVPRGLSLERRARITRAAGMGYLECSDVRPLL